MQHVYESAESSSFPFGANYSLKFQRRFLFLRLRYFRCLAPLLHRCPPSFVYRRPFSRRGWPATLDLKVAGLSKPPPSVSLLPTEPDLYEDIDSVGQQVWGESARTDHPFSYVFHTWVNFQVRWWKTVVIDRRSCICPLFSILENTRNIFVVNFKGIELPSCFTYRRNDDLRDCRVRHKGTSAVCVKVI